MKSLYAKALRGELPHIILPGSRHLRFKREELEAILEAHRRHAAAAPGKPSAGPKKKPGATS